MKLTSRLAAAIFCLSCANVAAAATATPFTTLKCLDDRRGTGGHGGFYSELTLEKLTGTPSSYHFHFDYFESGPRGLRAMGLSPNTRDGTVTLNAISERSRLVLSLSGVAGNLSMLLGTNLSRSMDNKSGFASSTLNLVESRGKSRGGDSLSIDPSLCMIDGAPATAADLDPFLPRPDLGEPFTAVDCTHGDRTFVLTCQGPCAMDSRVHSIFRIGVNAEEVYDSTINQQNLRLPLAFSSDEVPQHTQGIKVSTVLTESFGVDSKGTEGMQIQYSLWQGLLGGSYDFDNECVVTR